MIGTSARTGVGVDAHVSNERELLLLRIAHDIRAPRQ